MIKNMKFYIHFLWLVISRPLLFIQFWRDDKKYLKDNPPDEIRHQRKRTTYPDDQPEYNKWIEHIFKQRR